MGTSLNIPSKLPRWNAAFKPNSVELKPSQNANNFQFEYQQAQLEKEVEELAWAVERAEVTARGALEAHMHRAEHKRQVLLHDFFF
ncbi:hypothetical protein CAEBREN_16280 [Caenorhabditis brenneri]|uniref:Uncharacterized protein n=1 Tax=Caenorhabditis brenneri TaxID=135651 RepID=G0PE71_CAEBE|nr:hypothetical protein CAEBREN_16280 [Caenorhabditis brenneri]